MGSHSQREVHILHYCMSRISDFLRRRHSNLDYYVRLQRIVEQRFKVEVSQSMLWKKANDFGKVVGIILKFPRLIRILAKRAVLLNHQRALKGCNGSERPASAVEGLIPYRSVNLNKTAIRNSYISIGK